MARFFVPFVLNIDTLYSLPDEVVRHVMVRRFKQDEIIELFNGDGFVYQAIITSLSKRSVEVLITQSEKINNESNLHIGLAQSISSGERMDFTLQKCVELGVNEFWPIQTQRSIVQLDEKRAQKRVMRWQDIVVSACEQSGRTTVPIVHPITTFELFLKHLPQQTKHIMLSVVKKQSLKNYSKELDQNSWCLLVGPEGGLTELEEQQAMDKGFEPVTLGPRVLRTETAAIAAVSAMQTLWGDF
ncbi:16S rRNA (uracil(1498)-N(3))-methyltransferase [Neisseria sp. Ec49-e6-T10]|uniref:16S rRNA (uracil(1498)-N(3))-methyltransferase n=1 Tax=Neisseria sp. Ec49-e6-T10 TaxID=3140744 RepID=UPI003EB7E840